MDEYANIFAIVSHKSGVTGRVRAIYLDTCQPMNKEVVVYDVETEEGHITYNTPAENWTVISEEE